MRAITTVMFFSQPLSGIVGFPSNQTTGDPNMSTAVAPANTSISGELSRRYRDAYAVAKGIIAVGNAIKIGAVVLGAVMVFFGLAGPSFVTGIMIAMGILVGVAGFAAGILVSAQGQIMQSVVDTAVNTSPQISPEQKIQVMGLMSLGSSSPVNTPDTWRSSI